MKIMFLKVKLSLLKCVLVLFGFRDAVCSAHCRRTEGSRLVGVNSMWEVEGHWFVEGSHCRIILSL